MPLPQIHNSYGRLESMDPGHAEHLLIIAGVPDEEVPAIIATHMGTVLLCVLEKLDELDKAMDNLGCLRER